MKNPEEVYKTIDLVMLFTHLLKDGYSAMSLQLIVDLIEDIEPAE